MHGSLSVDSIFIRLDGNIVIADVGVGSLIEHDFTRDQSYAWSDGDAPEQLLGRPAGPASDVYALGMVVFYLLTGSAVFDGATSEELVQKHLHQPVPAVSQVRRGLPPGLSGVLARALAKDPAQRFSQPGAFANAYHQSGVPINRMRVPFLVSEAPAVQVYQAPESGASIPDIPLYERSRGNNGMQALDAKIPLPPARTTNPHSLHGFPDDETLRAAFDAGPRPSILRRVRQKQRQRSLLIAALAVVVMGSLVVGLAAFSHGSASASSATGQ